MFLPPNGDPASPIWLLGDSAPIKIAGIRHALDPRHPTRHTIWTSVLEAIQERLFSFPEHQPRRLSHQALYTANAVDTVEAKSSDAEVSRCFERLRQLSRVHRPRTIITFGSFAYEFAVAAVEGGAIPKVPYSELKLSVIRDAFDKRVVDDGLVVVPLLHQIVALKFAQCHDAYSAEGFDSYYEYCGMHLANRLLQVHCNDRIWVTRDEN